MECRCKFCGKEIHDHYMLNDHVWWRINLDDDDYRKMLVLFPDGNSGLRTFLHKEVPKEIKEKIGGFICLDCVRNRLGRDFILSDFPMNIPINLCNDYVFNEVYLKLLTEPETSVLKKIDRQALIDFDVLINQMDICCVQKYIDNIIDITHVEVDRLSELGEILHECREVI